MSVPVKMSVNDITEPTADYLAAEENVHVATVEMDEQERRTAVTYGSQVDMFSNNTTEPNTDYLAREVYERAAAIEMDEQELRKAYSPKITSMEHFEHNMDGRSGRMVESKPFHSVQKLMDDCKAFVEHLLGEHDLENKQMLKICRDVVDFHGKAIIAVIEQRIDWTSTKIDIVKIEKDTDEKYKARVESARSQIGKLTQNIDDKRKIIDDLEKMNEQLNFTIQTKTTELLQKNSEINSFKKTISTLREKNSQLKNDLQRSIDEREKDMFDGESVNFECRKEMLGSLLIEYEETERARKQLYVHVVQNIRHEYMAINKIELETVRRQCETRIDEARKEYKQASQELSDVKTQLFETSQRLKEKEQEIDAMKQQLKQFEYREQIKETDQRHLMNSAKEVHTGLQSVTKHNIKLHESIRKLDGLIDAPRSEWADRYEEMKVQFTAATYTICS